MSDRLLTARELGEAIGLKPGTVLDKWQRGKFPGYRFGRAVRFSLDEILALGRIGPDGRGETPVTPPRPTNGVVSALPVTRRGGTEDA